MKKASKLINNQKRNIYPKQNTQKWLDCKRKMITSTNCYGILCENKYDYPYKIINNKINNKITPPNIFMTHGNTFEPIARRMYEIMHNIKVHELGLITHSKYKFLGASPDGITNSGILLEIKCPLTRLIKTILKRYWIQVQIQMEVCDLEVVHFMECKFKYYNKFSNFLKSENKWKGTHDEKSFTINTDDFVQRPSTKYWYCDKYHILEIKRDREWFKSALPKLIKCNSYLQSCIISPQKINSIPYRNWDEWINAAEVKNYINDDPILDWLEMYYNKTKLSKHISPGSNEFNILVKKQQNIFKKKIWRIIKATYSSYITINSNRSLDERFEQTKNAMRKKIPLIHNPVLLDDELKIYGTPDLIVLSNYLENIVDYPPQISKDIYIVVDIKLKNMLMHVNKKTLMANPIINYYKAKLYIYLRILNKIQNSKFSNAYILGKSWSIKKNGKKENSGNPFERLGEIKFKDIDNEYREKTKNAINWIRSLRLYGGEWSINPPSIYELYPNMNNTSTKWGNVKNHIANNIKELTLLWNCGPKNRKLAHSKGVFKWNDVNCTSEILGHSGTKIAGTLQAIIDINKDYNKRRRLGLLSYRKKNLMEPRKIKSLNKFKNSSKLNLYVDFETIPGIISGLDDLIFMIGVGWHTSKWNYKCFAMSKLSYDEEESIINQFNDFVSKFKNSKIYHWGHIEKTQYRKSTNRYKNYVNHNWCDLLNLFRDEPIVIKGAFNYSIKSIGKAMYKNNMIDTTWDGDIDNGLEASAQIYKALKNGKSIKKIMKYNEIDCKVLYSIFTYL